MVSLPQHHPEQSPLLLSCCMVASGRRLFPMSPFSVKICYHNGIISKCVYNHFKLSLTVLLHRGRWFTMWGHFLNLFLKWVSTYQTTVILFIFSLVHCKEHEMCCQVEGFCFCFCRIVLPLLSSIAAFCKYCCALVATYILLLFLRRKSTFFHRIMEWLELERTLTITLFQSPAMGRDVFH